MWIPCLQTLSVRDLEQLLQSGAAAAQEQRIRAWFGKEVAAGTLKTQDTDAAWAVEADSPPTMIAEDGSMSLPLKLVAGRLYAGTAHLKSGDGFNWHFEAGGKRLGSGFLEVYSPNPDLSPGAAVPGGTAAAMGEWKSHIFEGTTRKWDLYLPPGSKPDQELPVMVFQDGQWMKAWVPAGLDSLIARGEIPPMAAVFIEPGVFEGGKSNRSFEYDTLSDQYVRFLLDEILPEVSKRQKLTTDPDKRAICGLSSGGICSFTAAWQRPDAFRKVLSAIGSFTNIAHGPTDQEGGHNYPALIRVKDKKPIRVFLQDGANDLDNQWGNWPLANQQMAKALAFKGYDFRFEYGKGNHSDRHLRAIFSDAMRWLWRP